MRRLFFITLVIVVFALVLSTGCTDSGSTSSVQTQTSTSTVTPTAFTEQPTTSTELVPGPTEVPPSKYLVDVQVSKDIVYGTITATFRGGLGQNFVSDIIVDVYYADGSTETKHLTPVIGEYVEFDGNKNKKDRVKVTVVYDGSLGTYVISDQLVPEKLPTTLS